jgi:hypothetical protein
MEALRAFAPLREMLTARYAPGSGRPWDRPIFGRGLSAGYHLFGRIRPSAGCRTRRQETTVRAATAIRSTLD